MDYIMKKASTPLECIYSFESEPLRDENYDTMFCDTHEARTGDKYVNPISFLEKSYKEARNPQHTLLIGHSGSGKSTEMQTFVREMRGSGYFIVDISAMDRLDMNSASYTDMFIMIMIELIENAVKEGLRVRDEVADDIKTYWKKVTTKTSENGKTYDIKLDAGLNVFFASLKGTLRAEKVTREKIQTVIDPEIDEFISLMRYISENIKDELRAKGRPQIPIVVVDDLDKLIRKSAEDIFFTHGGTIAMMPFHVICTFPIQLTYSSEFESTHSYFEHRPLPMIKLRSWSALNGYTPFPQGWDAIRKIVGKRAKEDLIKKEALDIMIEKTGGFLRDIFIVIKYAAMRADSRVSERIEEQDAKAALKLLRGDISRMIHGGHYETLAEIYSGIKGVTKNSEVMLDLLRSRAVLEYNGDRWCDLHPLVEDLLLENRIIEKKVKND
jgi:hypothetical protein